MAEKCAKTSSPPPSGSMKPKPLASLNHLTVPRAIPHLLLFSARHSGRLRRAVSIRRWTAGSTEHDPLGALEPASSEGASQQRPSSNRPTHVMHFRPCPPGDRLNM